MPAQLERLRTRPEFLRVAGAHRKCVKPGLILQVCRLPKKEGSDDVIKDTAPRVGLTASRRVGSAVERNRARRRLRAAAREIMLNHAMPGHDYVIIARKETLKRPYAELLKDLEAALRTLGTFRLQSGTATGDPGP